MDRTRLFELHYKHSIILVWKKRIQTKAKKKKNSYYLYKMVIGLERKNELVNSYDIFQGTISIRPF